MDYWYDIIKSYDDHKSKNPGKRDDGTYSQFSVVILLMYLTLGEDYPYNIAQFFRGLEGTEIYNRHRSSTLRNPGKVGTLLKKMAGDKLVLVSDVVENGLGKKYYRLNPAILQSLVRDGTHYRKDGSAFEIPKENIEKYLVAYKKLNEEDGTRDRLFKKAILPEIVDLFSFLVYFSFVLYIKVHLEPDHTMRDIGDYKKELMQLPDRDLNLYKDHIIRFGKLKPIPLVG